jgi:MFS family permease
MNNSSDPSAGKLTTGPGRPTWVRWRIVALLVALSFLSWFLRVSMSVAYDEKIKDQFGIRPETMGYVYSAYLAVYMLCMTPGGWFIDRFGARTALIIMGFGLTLFGAMTGLVGLGTELLAGVPAALNLQLTTAGLALVLFLVVRSIMGAFATPMYPAATHAVARWIPFRRRGAPQGLVQGAACVGIAATPLVFGSLIDRLGWPQAFLVLAVCTSLVSLLWAAYATDRPEQHPSVSPAEQRLIRAGEPDISAAGDFAPVHVAGEWEAAEAESAIQAAPGLGVAGAITATAPSAVLSRTERTDAQHVLVPAGGGGALLLLRNRSLVLLTVSYAAVGYFEYLFFFWMDYYFKEKLGLPDEVRRVYAGIPILAMASGMVAGGWLSDWMVRLYGYRTGRALVPVVGMLGGALFLGAGAAAGEPRWIVFWFSLALGAVGAVEAPTWNTALELGGRRGGTAAGICNTGGNLGGLIAPIVTPWVGEHYNWSAAIGLAAVVCLLGAGLWRWIDPRERVHEKTGNLVKR